MPRQNLDDELRKDVIVDIPKDREHRFGWSGSMLKPSRASVEALVMKIPRGMVITMPVLRDILAESNNAQVTCPFLTKRALMAIAADTQTKVPYWRVVMANGEMINFYHGGGTKQATHLKNEGVSIEARQGKYRVMKLEKRSGQNSLSSRPTRPARRS